MPLDQPVEDEMSFLSHLEVLRWHLVRSVIATIVAALVVFVSKTIVFDVILFGPKNQDFITVKLLCQFSHWLNAQLPTLTDPEILCIKNGIPELQNIYMAGQFSTHIMVSLIGGLIIAFPYVVWELWRFVKPALEQKEQNGTRGVVASVSLLFITGVLFGYYVISPLSVNFLINYQVSEQVQNIPTLSAYINTVTGILLACGVLFQLPVAIFFLTRLGLISPAMLKAYRRHAGVGILILSAVITPPDVFSQILVCFPLLLLYEVSIGISKRVYKPIPA